MSKLNSKTLLAWASAFAFALCAATGVMAMTPQTNTPVHCGSCGAGGETEDHDHEKKDDKKKDDKKKDEKKKDEKKKDDKKKDDKPK